MLNKNDPLIGAVQEVMKRNQAERDAARVVNEYFGIEDRKALPHEHQGQWDAAYKQVLNESDDMGPVKKKESAKMYKHKTSGKEINSVKNPGKDWEVMKEELHPNQQKLDVHEPEKDKLTAKDFKMLRAKKKPMEESDVTSPSSMGIKKPDYAPAGTTPDYAKPKTQTVNRAAKTSLPVGTIKEAVVNKIMKKLAEKKMTNAEMAKREEIAKSMKPVSNWEKRYPGRGKEVMYATATKQAMKEEKEGFNNRHGLSVTASAEKQAVAVLNEDDIDSYENRMTAGLGQPYTPYGGGRFGGGTAKTGTLARRPVRIDPGLRNVNTRTGEKINTSSGPRTRKRLVPKKQSAAVQGTMQGQVAKMRQQSGNVAPVRTNMSAADASKLRIDQAKREIRRNATVTNRAQSSAGARPAVQQGNAPNAAAANAARIARIANRPKTPNAAAANAARIAKGGSALAAGAGLELATSSTPVGNQPPSASAATNVQTNLKPANVMSAKPSFEFSDKQREAAKKGKAGIKDVQAWAQSRGIKADPSSKEILRNYLNAAQNKTMKTDVKAGGTAATPTQTAAQSAELKMKAGMAQRSGPSVPAKPTSSATPSVQPARNSTLAAPSAMAAAAPVRKPATFGPK
jgi:hypothetical protein